MNIVIIEDEFQTGWDIDQCIKTLRPHFKVQAILDSVESAIEWFSHRPSPDLIFSDIQLGDGLAFEIFKKVKLNCPVIFCTAFDEYAIQAFQNNGIDYLLKPISEKQLEKSLKKMEILAKMVTPRYDPLVIDKLIRSLYEQDQRYKKNFLVGFRDQMIPVHVDEIAFFYIGDGGIELRTLNNIKYRFGHTLESLESQLDPKAFFRANRQFLISFRVIKQIEHYADRKLLVRLSLAGTDAVIVSKAKASAFLRWMEDR